MGLGINAAGALKETKALFLSTMTLKFPKFSKVLYFQTNSSGVTVGTELYQLIDDSGEHGVACFPSRVLRGPELIVTVREKELLQSTPVYKNLVLVC